MSENKIYIEKSKVLKAVEALRPTRLFYDSEIEFKAAMRIFNAVKNRIGHAKSTKAADVAPEVCGHWKAYDDENGLVYAVCSSCKWDSGEAWAYANKYFDFCPRCGAKMDEREE